MPGEGPAAPPVGGRPKPDGRETVGAGETRVAMRRWCWAVRQPDVAIAGNEWVDSTRGTFTFVELKVTCAGLKEYAVCLLHY